MKKFVIAMVALLGTFFSSADAMSYEQAREQALFLTDKMAYELNLNEEQYEAAYEVNLDYLLGVNSYDDVYGDYWIHRNADLRYILLDWQYNAYCAANYFYRPLWWADGFWHFGIYSRYPHRDYFYFGRPHFFATYRGGHSWHMNGGRSWYGGRSFGTKNHGSFSGMRDGWNRGDYRGSHAPAGNRGVSAGTRGNSRQMGAGHTTGRTSGGSFGGYRGSVAPSNGTQSGTTTRQSSTRTTVERQGNVSGQHSGSTTSRSGSFSSGRSTSTPSRSMSAPSQSRSSSSSAGGSSRSSGSSMGGGSHGSSSGSSHGGGFGGRR